jgi:hypothetical protein
LALFWSFSSGIGVRFAQSSSKWEAQTDIPEEMSQSLLQIKSKETRTKYTPVTLLSQRKLTITAINRLFTLENN